MSLVESAIQRAKQMGLGPAAVQGQSGSAAPLRIKALHRHVVHQQRAATVNPNYPVLVYDEAACAQFHIMTPRAADPAGSAATLPPYRMLRARVLQRCRTDGWSTLAITSPGPGEGKSVTAANLALVLARSGNHDVYLLDLDLRKPSICRYLGVTPVHELTDYFWGTTPVRDVFFTLRGVEHLSIAGSVQGDTQASELLSGERFEQILEYIRHTASNPFIVIDLPPVVVTDDALVVAPRVDATLLVVSESVTKRESLARAVDLLADFKVAGIALNRASDSSGAEYYGYYGY